MAKFAGSFGIQANLSISAKAPLNSPGNSDSGGGVARKWSPHGVCFVLLHGSVKREGAGALCNPERSKSKSPKRRSVPSFAPHSFHCLGTAALRGNRFFCSPFRLAFGAPPPCLRAKPAPRSSPRFPNRNRLPPGRIPPSARLHFPLNFRRTDGTSKAPASRDALSRAAGLRVRRTLHHALAKHAKRMECGGLGNGVQPPLWQRTVDGKQSHSRSSVSLRHWPRPAFSTILRPVAPFPG
jgi:hypothetical protein